MATNNENQDHRVMKERALFYLDRRLREVETQVHSQQDMAKAEMSYVQRRQAGESEDTAESAAQLELGALRWARDKIQEI